MVNLGLLDYNIWLMKTIGLWPLESASRPLLILNSLYTALLMVSLAVASVCQVIEIFVSPNIITMASTIDLATLTASALFKLIYMIYYHKYFQRLVDKINSTFVERDFFDGTFMMADWVKYSKVVITVYVAIGGLSLFIVGGLFSYAIPQYFTRYHTNVNEYGNLAFPYKKRWFPFNCWYPFDVTWSPVYEITYVFELMTLVASGQIYLIGDSFFFMIIYLICGQLELIKNSYKSLQEATITRRNYIADDNYKCHDSKNLWEIESKKQFKESSEEQNLKLFVDHHSNLIDIMRDVDSLLRSLVVVDFVHAVLSLSFATFQIFSLESVPEKLQMLLFFVVSVTHQFLNNFFAEILTQQQLSMSEAMYETQWVKGTDLHKMAVYMTMAQSNHPTRLTGWRMYHLGHGTFVEFMKLLGSYVLVIQSLQGNEVGRI